jgi:preprotein translocase subunit SecB
MENKTKKAAFTLSNYKITNASLNYEVISNQDKKIKVDFNPSGVYNQKNGLYKLTLDFYAFEEGKVDKENPFIRTVIIADYQFENVTSLDEIPVFFYSNSIAIIYPYIRAFVSNLSLQANMPPFILPTLNLSMLESTLKDNTIEV